MSGRCERPRLGFTLLELLVVMGIVTLLAGVITPVTASALRKAKHTSCASNLRQIGCALMLYASEYDEYLPPYTNDVRYIAAHGPDSGTEEYVSGLALVDCVEPWLRSKNVWFCPSDPDRGKGIEHDCIRHELTSYWYRPLRLNEPPIWPIRFSLVSDTALGDRILQDAAWFAKGIDGMEVHTCHEDDSVNYLRPDGGIGYVPPQP